MKRQVKAFLKNQLVNVFHVGQALGVDILPRHFYSEIPAIKKLRTTDEWRKPYTMVGVQGWNADEQLQFVRSVMTDETRRELASRDIYTEACQSNNHVGYGPVEAQFLYGFVRQHRPQRIIQVGSGISTAVCLEAAKAANYQPQITCIDPYPTAYLTDSERQKKIVLINEPVENLDLEFLKPLTSGDLFFVDSTHTLGPAGEVTRIITEMLPRLAPGVFVHFHDIYFPYDFVPTIWDTFFFWHETALLLAYLTNNPRIGVSAALMRLHCERLSELQPLFPRYKPMQLDRGVRVVDGDVPSSVYLQVLS
jgi:hypothetical protein